MQNESHKDTVSAETIFRDVLKKDEKMMMSDNALTQIKIHLDSIKKIRANLHAQMEILRWSGNAAGELYLYAGDGHTSDFEDECGYVNAAIDGASVAAQIYLKHLDRDVMYIARELMLPGFELDK